MKIAVASNDGKSVTAHFSQASHYVVFILENGRIASREMREKPAHKGTGRKAAQSGEQGRQRGMLRATLASISDCDMVIARQMGTSAYLGVQEAGLKPLLTEIEDVEEVAKACIQGRLVDHPEFQKESLRARQLSLRLGDPDPSSSH